MTERKERNIGITVFLPSSMIDALDNYMPHVSRNKAVFAILQSDKKLMKSVARIQKEEAASGKRL